MGSRVQKFLFLNLKIAKVREKISILKILSYSYKGRAHKEQVTGFANFDAFCMFPGRDQLGSLTVNTKYFVFILELSRVDPEILVPTLQSGRLNFDNQKVSEQKHLGPIREKKKYVTENLFYARLYARCFANILLFNPYNCVISPIYI